jgi:hypothetical protein
MGRHTARSKAAHNAMAHNNQLPKEWLKRLPDEQLICFVHPDTRDQLKVSLGLSKPR